MELLTHNGYKGTVETSIPDGVIHGKVLFISDLVTYQGTTIPELIAAFNEAVDDYLATCKEIGKEADKPAGGAFNVRVGEERHQNLILRSLQDNTSINALVTQAIDNFLATGTVEHNHHHAHEVSVTIKGAEMRSVTTGQRSVEYFDSVHTSHHEQITQH